MTLEQMASENPFSFALQEWSELHWPKNVKEINMWSHFSYYNDSCPARARLEEKILFDSMAEFADIGYCESELDFSSRGYDGKRLRLLHGIMKNYIIIDYPHYGVCKIHLKKDGTVTHTQEEDDY